MSSYYGKAWDHYVTHVFDQMKRPDSVYPGDEWGNPTWWNIVYERMLANFGAADWNNVVEIGPGSGKYTTLLLERTPAKVLAFDVSQEYLQVLERRAAAAVRSGRLSTAILECVRPDEMLTGIERAGWRGSLDAMISIDAMVHVDLQYLVAYLMTAAICLRPRGKLVMTLADATSEKGRDKLFNDVKLYYPRQGEISLKFEFLSPDIVSAVLDGLGFEIAMLDHGHESPGLGISSDARDIFLVAEKVSSDEAAIESFLR